MHFFRRRRRSFIFLFISFCLDVSFHEALGSLRVSFAFFFSLSLLPDSPLLAVITLRKATGTEACRVEFWRKRQSAYALHFSRIGFMRFTTLKWATTRITVFPLGTVSSNDFEFNSRNTLRSERIEPTERDAQFANRKKRRPNSSGSSF